MSLSITATSTDQEYSTTSALQRIVLGATTTVTSTQQTDLLAANVRAASRWADTFLGYPLAVQTYRETVAAYGRRTLRLSRTPILAVAAVYDATDTGTATALTSTQFRVEDADAGLLTRDIGFPWTPALQPAGTGGTFYPSSMPLEATPLPGQEYRPWLVDYVAGWAYGGISTGSANWSTVLGATSTGRTLPDDVEQGVLYKAQAFYEGADEAQTERLGDLEVNYRSLGTDSGGRLITRADAVLAPYRRFA